MFDLCNVLLSILVLPLHLYCSSLILETESSQDSVPVHFSGFLPYTGISMSSCFRLALITSISAFNFQTFITLCSIGPSSSAVSSPCHTTSDIDQGEARTGRSARALGRQDVSFLMTNYSFVTIWWLSSSRCRTTLNRIAVARFTLLLSYVQFL